MVYRIFVEKKEAVASEAKALMSEIKTFLGIEKLEGLRIINRYDVEGIEEELFKVGFCLPAGPYVTDEDVRYIVESIREAIVG